MKNELTKLKEEIFAKNYYSQQVIAALSEKNTLVIQSSSGN